MKSGTSFPGKRDETLRSTLIEFAKKVSFPNWNAMHGIENGEGKTVGILPTALNAVSDNVINLKHMNDSKGVIENSLKDNDDAFTAINDVPDENVRDSCQSNSSEDISLSTEGDSGMVDGTINGQRGSDSPSEITRQTPNHCKDLILDDVSHSDVKPSTYVENDERNSKTGTSDHLRMREFGRPELSRTRSDSDVFRNVSNQMETTQRHDNLQTDDEMAKIPFRKKSMSFAGTLPIRIEVTQDKMGSDTSNSSSSSSVKLFQKQVKEAGPVRYDRFMSVGDASASIRRSPKSPRRSRKSIDKKVNDPSHYLGRRRGSYNPTYEQTQVALPAKGKERYNQRARSLFVGTTISEDEFRKSLASRLMKVASPALRESLSEENEPMEEHMTEVVADTVSEREEESHLHATNGKENGNSLSVNDLRRRKSSPISQIVAANMIKEDADITNHSVDKPAKIMMRRRPWENSSGGVAFSKHINTQSSRQADSENERNSAYFSIACNSSRERARRPIDNHSSSTTKSEHGTRNGAKKNGIKQDSQAGLANGKASSQWEEVNLMKRYQRQSRSRSCFGSLQPSTFSDSDFYDGSFSRRNHDPSSSSSSDEGGKEGGYTIHAAAKAGKLKRLRKLVENGVDVNVLDDNSWPAIHYALLGGHFNCVAYLLTKGADIRHYSKGRTLKYFK